MRPHIYLKKMNSSIENKNTNIQNLIEKLKNEEVFQSYLDSISPSGEELIKKVICSSHSEDPTFKLREEEIIEYLKCFLCGCSKDMISDFLEFVTGCETLVGLIHIQFNSEDNENLLLPKANTCSKTLHLTRYINSQEHFDGLMRQALKKGSHWSFFSV